MQPLAVLLMWTTVTQLLQLLVRGIAGLAEETGSATVPAVVRNQAIPDEAVAEVIFRLTKRLHCGCVVLLHAEEELAPEQRVARLQRRLSAQKVLSVVAGVHGARTACVRHRPLNVLLSGNNASRSHLRQVSEGPGLAGPTWLLLLPALSEESFLEGVHVPLDSAVLVARGSAELVFVHEVYRVAAGTPLLKGEVGRWSPSGGLAYTRLFFYERRSSLHGLVLSTAVKHVAPFTVLGACGSNVLLEGGFFGSVWKALQQRMNFSSVYHADKPSQYGGVDVNGTWTGIPGMVARNESEVGFGDVTMTSEKAAVVDFTFPLIAMKYEVFIQQPDMIQLEWNVFLRPFTWQLWIAIACTIAITATHLTMVHCLGRYFGNEEQQSTRYNLYESLFIVFGAFCQQGQADTPRAASCRIVYAVVYFTAVIILASYSAILISFLAVQRYSLPFTSLQGLLEDGSYQFGVLANSTEYNFFRNTSDPVMKQLYTKLMLPDADNFPQSDKEAFNRICTMKFAYMIPFEYTTQLRQNSTCVVVTLPTKYFQLSLSIALTKRSSYRGIFNYNLQVLRRSGLLQKLHDKTWPRDIPPETSMWSSVDVEHMVPLLTVLGAGIALAILLLGAENGTDKQMERRHTRYLQSQPNTPHQQASTSWHKVKTIIAQDLATECSHPQNPIEYRN